MTQPLRISDRIETADKRLLAIKDMTTEIMKAIEEDDRDILDEEQAQLDELSVESDQLQKNLEGLRRAEKIMAQKAVPAQQAVASKVPASARNEKNGDLLVKTAVCNLMSHYTRSSPIEVANKMYRDDARMDAITRTAVNPADTTTVGWAAELVQDALQGFMDDIRPDSLYAQLAALGLAINFGGNSSVTIPGWAGTGTDMAGSFVGEGNPIPVKRGTMTSSTLQRHKLAVISTFTEELADLSTPAIEGLVREKIRLDTIETIDQILFDGNPAVAGLRPESIISGVAGQASAGNTTAQIMTDLKYLITTLSTARRGRRQAWVMADDIRDSLGMITGAADTFLYRDEVSAGRLLGRPILSSMSAPAGNIFLIDAADFATASGTPTFNVSREATLVELNDDGSDPTMDMPTGTVTVDGAAGVTGGPAPVRSLFQTYSVGLRMILPMSWAMMRTSSVARVTGVAY